MSSPSEEDWDARTVEEYLQDVREIERRGWWKNYSSKRRALMEYWEGLLAEGRVSPKENLTEALRRLRAERVVLR